jgi:hypothetical protein
VPAFAEQMKIDFAESGREFRRASGGSTGCAFA